MGQRGLTDLCTLAMKKLEENISVSKNQYEAIEVDVLDEDPKMAQRICQSLIHFMDLKAISLIHNRALEVAAVNKKAMEDEKVILSAHADFLYESFDSCGFDVDIELECKQKDVALVKYLKDF